MEVKQVGPRALDDTAEGGTKEGALYIDPFAPALKNSPSLDPSIEQLQYIEAILKKACSDSRFVQKAYDSIILVLQNKQTVAAM